MSEALQSGMDPQRSSGEGDSLECTALIGQNEAEAALVRALRRGKVGYAWLFSGEEGIGKATLATQFACVLLSYTRADLCRGIQIHSLLDVDPVIAQQVKDRAHPNLNCLSHNPITIDDVRLLRDTIRHSSWSSSYARIYIIDALNTMTRQAVQALLTFIEERPEDVIFLMIAHQNATVPATLRSRCTQLRLRPLQKNSLEMIYGQQLPSVSGLCSESPPLNSMEWVRLISEPGSLQFVERCMQLLDALNTHPIEEKLLAIRTILDSILEEGGYPKERFLLFCLLYQWHISCLIKKSGSLSRAQLNAISGLWKESENIRNEHCAFNLDPSPLVFHLLDRLRKTYRNLAF